MQTLEDKILSDSSVVLYLPLYKRDGTKFLSEDAYGQTCTVTGSLWTSQGRYFDGVDDFISCGARERLNFERTSPFTISFWMKPTAVALAQATQFINKISAVGSYPGYLLCTATNGSAWLLRFIMSNNYGGGLNYIQRDYAGYYIATADIAYFIVITYDGSSTAAGVKFYQDKILKSATTVKDTLTASMQSTANLEIGRGYGNLPIQGLIPEVIFHNRVLPQPEIIDLYDLTRWRYA